MDTSAPQRAVYAQAWLPRSHCYHPSLPPRRLRMIEDFAAYRATMLTWPSLGGGGISLPYLEQEADGDVPARYRVYGYLSDREFIRECHDRGIAAFSVIFCMQGWEFPAELSDDEDEVLALNELRGVGKRTWLGLREFTQNTYPKLWAPFEKYFPDGLRNSDGESVTDLWQECCARDIHGQPIHAHWVECPDREHQCHYMDLNNPVWREYVKAIIRIQIDAGVDGIQFDEPSSPLSALQYGGCFCRDCMTGFTDYLRGLPGEQLPEEVRAALPDFHYGRWLLERGEERIDPKNLTFLSRAYARYLQARTAENFTELARYARAYAAQQGRTVLLSSNLYDGLPCFDPLVAELDVLVPEQRTTLYQQPGWMRYIAGFAGDKPLAVNVNPYGGILPELAVDLGHGRGVDRYRTMLYEAAAMGVNMSVPYGAWMGSIIEDALYAPHQITVDIQEFLADHADLFSRRTFNDTAVVYSVDSYFMEITYRDMTVDDRDTSNHGEGSGRSVGFFAVADALAADRRPFDAVVFHDGVLREDDADQVGLSRYREVILPYCERLTERQVRALVSYLDAGGRVTVVGPIGGPGADAILAHAGTDRQERFSLTGTAQVRVEGAPACAVNIQRTATGRPALHIVNYDYEPDRDALTVARPVALTVRLDQPVTRARIHAPGTDAYDVAVASGAEGYQLTLRELDTYAIAELLP
ncbi:MAG TPA: hypothetical protein VGJ07_26985 [Rugosimonospora sp.]